MRNVILYKVNVRDYVSTEKVKGAQKKINEYINTNNLNVVSVSLFKEDDDYLFTLTCE